MVTTNPIRWPEEWPLCYILAYFCKDLSCVRVLNKTRPKLGELIKHRAGTETSRFSCVIYAVNSLLASNKSHEVVRVIADGLRCHAQAASPCRCLGRLDIGWEFGKLGGDRGFNQSLALLNRRSFLRVLKGFFTRLLPSSCNERWDDFWKHKQLQSIN